MQTFMVRKPELKRAVRVSLSLRREQVVGIERIATDDHHHEFSRVIQELVDQELKRRYGRDVFDEIAAGADLDLVEVAN